MKRVPSVLGGELVARYGPPHQFADFGSFALPQYRHTEDAAGEKHDRDGGDDHDD